MPPIVEELIPCPDPWDVARKLAHLPHLLFLDSSERHPERGRYSYVMADPAEWITDPTSGLDQLSNEYRKRHVANAKPELPPFQGGYAGLFGYGLAGELERLPESRLDEFRVPDLAVGRYGWVVAFDHRELRAWLIAKEYPPRKREHVFGALQSTEPPRRIEPRETPKLDRRFLCEYPSGLSGVSSNFPRDDYLAEVRRVIEYIHAGDVFQVNLSQRLLAPLAEHPLDLYGRLRERCPSPYGCYFDLGDFQILSASPEQFLKVDDGEVVTRPIKGTRPRGRTPDEDAALLRDLTTNPKDRAENVMIVDLLRNDLGRVCEFGTIRVPKVCEVETYNYVHHLVSEVRGKLRADRTPFDLLRAAFPGGSVTGAPKVRAMEIIAELEPTARGPYCGSVGFIGFDGAMESNILIRTFTAGRGWLQFPVGGGIVADSDPEREYEETLHKAAGLLRALAP
jgi:para-aminobenzoate synthetase component I